MADFDGFEKFFTGKNKKIKKFLGECGFCKEKIFREEEFVTDKYGSFFCNEDCFKENYGYRLYN